MKILVIAPGPPNPEETAGDFRFFALLTILVREHSIDFYSKAHSEDKEVAKAHGRLRDMGVHVINGDIEPALRRGQYDLTLFEFHLVAAELIDLVRAWQPGTKIVVDSVDVHFHRLRSKARLTQSAADVAAAEVMCREEIDTYSRADFVVTVSSEDQQVLEDEGLKTEIGIIPLIHNLLPISPHVWSERLELVFIGSYKWSPNIDAVVYFCGEVMPLLRRQVPNLRLRIIGSSPTQQILDLACRDVEVVGFVESTSGYLLSSDISIAPLRFGGGVKGKIAEAVAHGLPVVTTSIGAEGFGFRSGTDVMVADAASDFCAAIMALWTDKVLYETVRRNGWERIRSLCSTDTVERLIPEIIGRVQAVPAKRIPRMRKARLVLPHYYDKYVGWRFSR